MPFTIHILTKFRPGVFSLAWTGTLARLDFQGSALEVLMSKVILSLLGGLKPFQRIWNFFLLAVTGTLAMLDF